MNDISCCALRTRASRSASQVSTDHRSRRAAARSNCSAEAAACISARICSSAARSLPHKEKPPPPPRSSLCLGGGGGVSWLSRAHLLQRRQVLARQEIPCPPGLPLIVGAGAGAGARAQACADL